MHSNKIKVIRMKHLPLFLISLFIIISCENDEETFTLVGTWNISLIKHLDNKDCSVETSSTDIDSTAEGDISDIGEWSGTMTFTDSTATADYIFSIAFQSYCEILGGSVEDTTCTVEFEGRSVEMTETMFSEELCNEEGSEYSDGKCNMPMSFTIKYTLDGSEFCELDDEDEAPHCGTAEVTKTSATITMPNHEENECEIIELTK